jgi:hypothetical protein
LLVATTVAVVAAVTLGAVYLPVASIVPGVALELLTDHVTPPFAESPVTVAVNCVVPPDATAAVAGLTVTEMLFPVVVLLPPPQPEIKIVNRSANVQT